MTYTQPQTRILLLFIAIGCAAGGFTTWQTSEVQPLVSAASITANSFTTTIGDVNNWDNGYGYHAYPENYLNITNKAYGLWDQLGIFGQIGDLYEFDWHMAFNYGYAKDFPISTQQQGYDLYYNKFEQLVGNFTFAYDPPAYGGVYYCTTGHSMWQHYMAKWSPSFIGIVLVEVGENIIGANAKYAFMRGAAKQYSKQWGTVISSWHGPQADFNGWYTYPNFVPTPLLGHSVSFLSRVIFSTYFAGAYYQLLENGEVTLWSTTAYSYWNNNPSNANQTYSLSPYGNLFAAFHPFERFDRGTPFIPFAVVLPTFHGIFFDAIDFTSWITLPLGAPDLMNYVLMNTIWDGMFNQTTYDGQAVGNNENAQIANGPYGEIFDFFLEDVTSSVLADYAMVYYTGNIQINSSYASKLNSYANGGGFVIVNIAQLIPGNNQLQTGFSYTSSATSEYTLNSLQWGSTSTNIWSSQVNVCSVSLSSSATYQLNGNQNVPLMTLNPVGSGYIAVTLIPYLQDGQITKFLLEQLTPLVSPFTVTSPQGPHPIMYQFNKKSTGWVVTLINNNGVSKPNNGTTSYDNSRASTVTVAVNSQVIPGTVNGNINYYSIFESTVSTGSLQATSSFTMPVNPGQIMIFDIPFTYSNPSSSPTTASPTTAVSPTTSSPTTPSQTRACSQYVVSDVRPQQTWSSGSEWQFSLRNSGSSTPASVTIDVNAGGYVVSNGGNMQSDGSSDDDYYFTVSNPSGLTPQTMESYSFQVSGNPTTVEVTVSKC